MTSRSKVKKLLPYVPIEAAAADQLTDGWIFCLGDLLVTAGRSGNFLAGKQLGRQAAIMFSAALIPEK